MSLDHILLGVISLAPCSGYDMKAEFDKGGAGMLSALSFGSIYPRLKQLEQDGLVEVQEERAGGRRRRVYELTAKGWQALQSWLEESTQYPIPMRDDLLLKMLFWGAAGKDRAALIQQLQIRYEESTELVEYIADWQHDGKSFIDEYTALVLKYIQGRLEAELNWIQAAITQLKEEPSLPLQDPKWLAVLQKVRRTKALGGDEQGVETSPE